MSDFSVHYSAAPLPALGTDTTKVILENFSIVMTFVFSREALQDFHRANFRDHHEFLFRAFGVTPQQKATRALLELAVLYRALDDTQDIISTIDPENTGRWGELYTTDGKVERLSLRELMNKIIHAEEIGWLALQDPQIACYAAKNKKERWTNAKIPVSALAKACCGLAV